MNEFQLMAELFGIVACFVALRQLVRLHQGRDMSTRIMIEVGVIAILLLLCDMGTILFQGRPGSFALRAVTFCNYGLFVFEYLIIGAITHYIRLYLIERGKPTGWFWCFCVLMCTLGLVFLALNPWNHAMFTIDGDAVYHRGPGVVYCMAAAGAAAVTVVVAAIRRLDNKKEIKRFAVIVALPAAACAVQIHFYGLSLIALGITVSAVLLCLSHERDTRIELALTERRLLENRTYLLESHIRPRLLLNSLSDIRKLMDSNPAEADKAIGRLSRFLRRGLHPEKTAQLVHWHEEWEYTQDFLYLTRLHYGARLQVGEHIEEGPGFDLPFLTVEILVENAVSRSMKTRKNDGRVSVRTKRTDDAVYIIVFDNGINNDRLAEADEENLQIIRERLAQTCGGSLVTETIPGVGTNNTVRIPCHTMDKLPMLARKEQKEE